jgi:hypothetical protein
VSNNSTSGLAVRSFVSRAQSLLVVTGLLLAPAAYSAFDSANLPTDKNVRVLRVTPEGTQVPPGRQIVVTFDRPMMPLGNMDADAQKTVKIEPAPKCHWHWLDPRSLACELDASDTLRAATEYQITVNEGIKAEDGGVLNEAVRKTFVTERPVVREYSFREWRSPGTPVIRLVFNQPVAKDSVESSLAYNGQSGVTATPDPYMREVFYVLPLPGEKQAVVFPNGTSERKSDDRATTMSGKTGEQVEARRVWLVPR